MSNVPTWVIDTSIDEVPQRLLLTGGHVVQGLIEEWEPEDEWINVGPARVRIDSIVAVTDAEGGQE